MKWNEMEKNGSEQTHTEQAFLTKKPSFLPFRSVAFVHNNFFAKTSTLFQPGLPGVIFPHQN